MKKIILIFLIMCLLSGCGSVQTFETLGNISLQPPTQALQANVLLELPEDASEQVWEGEQETMYTCEEYTIILKTMASGDLKTTVQTLSGYDPEKLTVLETVSGKANRYDWVWTAVADEGDIIGRGAVLDDGSFHYCLCVMADAKVAGQLQQEWNELFSSFLLET